MFDLGLPELLDDGGVTLIEWGDAIVPVAARGLPRGAARRSATDDDERTIELRAVGPSWSARTSALGRALAERVAPMRGAAGC